MGGAIKAEVRKIFTTRLWWGLLIGVFVLAGLLAAAMAAMGSAAGGGGPDGNPTPLGDVETAQLAYSAGFIFTLMPLLPLALGVLVITSEFRHQTFSSTVLATPRRWKIPIAKVAAIIVVGTVYAIVYDVGAVIGGGLVLLAKGSGLYLGSGAVWQTLALCVLAFVIWTLLGFGFGMLVRNQMAAVFLALGLSFIGYLFLAGIFAWRGWDMAQNFLANNATISMLNPSLAAADPTSTTFPWWGSALLLIGYAAVLTAAGAFLTSRRDVT